MYPGYPGTLVPGYPGGKGTMSQCEGKPGSTTCSDFLLGFLAILIKAPTHAGMAAPEEKRTT
eukprot:3767220-Rhodomonas_salina.1